MGDDTNLIKYIIEKLENKEPIPDVILEAAREYVKEKQAERAIAEVLAEHHIEKQRKKEEAETIQGQYEFMMRKKSSGK